MFPVLTGCSPSLESPRESDRRSETPALAGLPGHIERVERIRSVEDEDSQK